MCTGGLTLPFVKTPSVPLFYEEEGRGTPVLFLHGGFGGVESTLYPKMSGVNGLLPPERFRTISFDRRNSGRSGYQSAETSLEDLAEDAKALLDALEIHRAIVIGDSLGGMIAQRFALDFPERTMGLVLLETSAHILRRPFHVKAALIALRVFGPRAMFRLFRNRFREPNWAPPIGPEAVGERLRRERERQSEFRARLQAMSDEELYGYSLALIRTYVAFSGRDLSDDLPKLRVPTRVLHGTADTLVRIHHGRELADLIPGARLIELAGLGHGLLYYAEAREALRTAVWAVAEPLTAEASP